MSNNDDFGSNINYDNLEQHTYDDVPGEVFYTCPRCGEEYLATFIVDHNGETMCIDCWTDISRN